MRPKSSKFTSCMGQIYGKNFIADFEKKIIKPQRLRSDLRYRPQPAVCQSPDYIFSMFFGDSVPLNPALRQDNT